MKGNSIHFVRKPVTKNTNAQLSSRKNSSNDDWKKKKILKKKKNRKESVNNSDRKKKFEGNRIKIQHTTDSLVKFSKNSSSINSANTPAPMVSGSSKTMTVEKGQNNKRKKWHKKHKLKESSEKLQEVDVCSSTAAGSASTQATKKHKSIERQNGSQDLKLPNPPLLSQTSSAVGSKTEEGASAKHHKRKKGSKKTHDGASNWMKLCSTLNIDATLRKTKAVKRPIDDTAEQNTSPEPKRAKNTVWFDNVDKILIETETGDDVEDTSKGKSKAGKDDDVSKALVKPDSFKGVTNCVAMDCEMVGVGPKGEDSILARVSIVNHFGVCLYDKFVLPQEKVTDYRTFVSGITEENLATGEEFSKVQKEVSEIIRGRILVGHAVHNDLRVLYLTHPHKMIRDTSQYKPFREVFSGRIPSLKKLSDKVLGVSVQEGQHSSVQDAQATMRLYTMYRQRWEKELKGKKKLNNKKNKGRAKKKKKSS